ncbi:MAG: disulfide bond formation protein B [Methyloprofundus sp.]|nr:disulfide bond formation protein B [Rhodospirillales bacterium]
MTASRIRLLNALGLLGISLILYIGFAIEFLYDELPCPLCLLQRVGFVFVMIGFMLNVMQGAKPINYGVVLVGALFGATMSLRQIAMHAIPGTGAYGSPIFGYHFYTWAFIIFVATIFGVAVLLLLTRDVIAISDEPLSGFYKLICWIAMVIVGFLVVMTFIECGPWECPGDPVNYWLFHQGGG